MRERSDRLKLGPGFHVTITEILADRGTVWLRVDSGHPVPPSSEKH